MIYAGIGSRNTPEEILTIFERMGSWLAKNGDVLRSGAAKGADTVFEKGCDAVYGRKEIFLPWKGFGGSSSEYYAVPKQAYLIARNHHPAWDKLSDAVQKLMARNTCQILGLDCETPCDFVVCYTNEGKDVGGTAQALRIARHFDIPIFNAGVYDNLAPELREKELIKDFNIFYQNCKKKAVNREIEQERD